MKQIFPKEVIENSYEVHHAMHSSKSNTIYLLITSSLLIAICSLFFIEVTIYNTSRGIIKPQKEHMIIQSVQSGKVIYQNLKNNTEVSKGDTLLIISNKALQEKTKNTQENLTELKLFIRDLRTLLAMSEGNLQTSKYAQERLYYKEKSRELEIKYNKAKADFERDRKLYEKNVIAKMEMDNCTLQYQVAKSNKDQYHKQQKIAWQNQLTDYEKQERELISTLSQFSENRELSVLTAPEDGTLLDVAGISEGSFINAGIHLATLSPKAALLVECYLSPADIGLIKNGNKANFQIDAFNYNQWGVATGKIVSVANDVQIENNMPVFKVRCELDQKALSLKNGFIGNFKKGMTLTARFELTDRSLFQLLYDKVDDWVNPNQRTIQLASN